MQYGCEIGKFKYLDNEGTYRIFKRKGQIWVDSRPKDNPQGYCHPIIPLNI